ncbi:MAG: phosphatidate cytidylyltransferase [Acidobacteriota bacterium]
MTQRILTTLILSPLAIGSIFYFPAWIFLLLITFILLLGTLELLRLLATHSVTRYWITFPFALAFPWVWFYFPSLLVPCILLAVIVILSWCVLGGQEISHAFHSVSGNLLVIFYLSLPLSVPSLLQPSRKWELLLVLLVVWGGDGGAYFIGRTWGRHKVTPRISPKKSMEGYIAAVFFSILVAVLFGGYLLPFKSVEFLVLMGALLGTSGILGDLFESMLKRGAGVKDSSSLIPGHGGLLDRIDSLLFAFPTYYLLALLRL